MDKDREIQRLRNEVKDLKKEMVKFGELVTTQIKHVSRTFTENSLRYAKFDYNSPSFEFSLKKHPEEILGEFKRKEDKIVIYLPSLKDTSFMDAYNKGHEEYLIKFLTESVQHEYIHAALKSIGLFSAEDEEALVDALIREEFRWWRDLVKKSNS
jgi:hypothetical protein